MRHLRTAALFVAIATATMAGCGSDDSPDSSASPDGGPSDTAAPSGEGGDDNVAAGPLDEAYCTALGEMAALQPAGSMTDEEFVAGFTAYADGADRAAEAAPPAHAEVLREFADLMRDTAVDSRAPDLAARVSEVSDSLFFVVFAAARDCDIVFGGFG